MWLASLDQPATVQTELAAVLAPDEQARAGRFYFERDRLRFVAGRGLLRMILGRYLAVAPERLRFEYTQFGRPLLADPPSDIAFNVSHSENMFVLAVAWGREIGVDVEAVRPLADAQAIAGRFFALGEQAVLFGLPAAELEEAFFRCWTGKEAYIKALGSGLSQPLDEFEVAFRPGEEPRLLWVKGKPEEAGRWRMVALEPAEGFVAAVIVEGQDWELVVKRET